jgi:hypothetical protein
MFRVSGTWIATCGCAARLAHSGSDCRLGHRGFREQESNDRRWRFHRSFDRSFDRSFLAPAGKHSREPTSALRPARTASTPCCALLYSYQANRASQQHLHHPQLQRACTVAAGFEGGEVVASLERNEVSQSLGRPARSKCPYCRFLAAGLHPPIQPAFAGSQACSKALGLRQGCFPRHRLNVEDRRLMLRWPVSPPPPGPHHAAA